MARAWLCAAVALAAARANAIGVDCSTKGSSFTVSNITVTPDPPVPGSAAVLLAQGTVSAAVTGGVTQLDVLLNQFPLYQANANTCGDTTITLPLDVGVIQIAGLTCPAAAGEAQNVSLTVTLPKGIPHGTYTLLLNGADAAKAPVFCLNATFKE